MLFLSQQNWYSLRDSSIKIKREVSVFVYCWVFVFLFNFVVVIGVRVACNMQFWKFIVHLVLQWKAVGAPDGIKQFMTSDFLV